MDAIIEELWVRVELMGHQSTFGRMSEKTLAGVACLQLEVPDTKGGFKDIEFFFPNSGSIYRIRACSRDAAVKGANPYVADWTGAPMLTDGYHGDESTDEEVPEKLDDDMEEALDAGLRL
jgi:hypothetical protein